MSDESKREAARLLEIIWRGVPVDYKRKYARSIWEQFENNVRSAAYTSNLGKMVNSLCGRMGVLLGPTGETRVEAERILNAGHDRELLKLLREETTLLVLMVRVATQERRDAWAAAHPQAEADDDEALAGPLFEGEEETE